jgi:predicted RNA-binding protein YlqC (UPF0109 family)
LLLKAILLPVRFTPLPTPTAAPIDARRFSMPLKELIRAIAVELVDHPDQVVVTEIAGEHNSLIELRVAKEDIGKVIGKDGRTAQSMRTILTAVSTKLGRRAHLDIVD